MILSLQCQWQTDFLGVWIYISHWVCISGRLQTSQSCCEHTILHSALDRLQATRHVAVQSTVS
jgi:hypothetical protein